MRQVLKNSEAKMGKSGVSALDSTFLYLLDFLGNLGQLEMSKNLVGTLNVLNQQTWTTLGLYLPKNGQIEPFKFKVMNWSTAWLRLPFFLLKLSQI